MNICKLFIVFEKFIKISDERMVSMKAYSTFSDFNKFMYSSSRQVWAITRHYTKQ